MNYARTNNLNYLVLYNTTDLKYLDILQYLDIERNCRGIVVLDMKQVYNKYRDFLYDNERRIADETI